MRVRVKQPTTLGTKRIDSSARIDNVVVQENLLEPEKESISIFFKGEEASGILNLSTREFEKLSNTLKPATHLIAKPLKTSKRTLSSKKTKTPSKKSTKRKTAKKKSTRKKRK